MDHNSQIRNVYTAAGMQENRKLDADTNGTTAEEAEGSAYPEKTAVPARQAVKMEILRTKSSWTECSALTGTFLLLTILCLLSVELPEQCMQLTKEKI